MDELTALLSSEPSFIVEGKISKDVVVEAALNLDKTLLDLLAADEKIIQFFFKKTANYLIFDKVRFQKFVLNKDFLPDSYTQFRINIGLSTDE